ncbi:DNA adenine methylase [Hyphomicrobium facile]|uniref:site-specific DNA-methyltransferase (adenine-specific) n=1 Tax=Hyphomicrobium facile TaxID=51670 RepID=A0A1I7NDZ7_9HYPH|nr:Dam family site-specific DNA-(adenine-N6)-methyltransferase [Hyphomicrobium facile]SFV32905.1 DNA adenine methylase [Hyphomicrobium facile]
MPLSANASIHGENRARGASVLRWAGSKNKSLGALSRFWSNGQTYVEPFCGSAALFFHLKPHRAYLSDLNSDLINTFERVRDHPESLWNDLSALPNDPSTYYALREQFNSRKLSEYQSAKIFLYLNRRCFNGLWRTNKRGQFNVPYGGEKTGSLPSLEHFKRASAQLSLASMKVKDFRVALSRKWSPRHFIYVDPPYLSARKRIFVDYNASIFRERDFDDLIDLLSIADKGGAKFVLTYKDTSKLRKACLQWNKHRISVTRNVGGFASSRKVDKEMIVTNVEG